MEQWVDIIGFSYIGVGIACAITYGVLVSCWQEWDAYEIMIAVLAGCFPWVALGMAGHWGIQRWFSIESKAARRKVKDQRKRKEKKC